MRVLICGDRGWTNSLMILKAVVDLYADYGDDLVIIEGEASGADTRSREAAEKLNIPVEKYPANWRLFKGQAGPIRNAQMLREGKPDLVYAFHNDIEHSKGTKDMVNQAKEKGIKVIIFKEE